MKHIVIRNFGPLKAVDINLSKINLIIGMQSSGKSCIMMIACYCSWVEKRIALRQSANEFMEGTSFIDMLTDYYHSKGYVHHDTYIEYHTDYMSFAYDNASRTFTQNWEYNRWGYKRPKVSYVPAERSMVSLISNWNRLETSYNCILDFKEDWDMARRHIKTENDILGTGISYEYDETNGIDSIITSNGIKLELTNSSSGVQSLIPQFVHMDYLYRGIYEQESRGKEKTFGEKQLNNNLLEILYKRNYKEPKTDGNRKTIVVHKDGKDFLFQSQETADRFNKETDSLLKTDHAEVFLEEPESNLFPTTQFQLMDWIVQMSKDDNHDNFFFIATHSPYILNHLLQENLTNFTLLLTYPIGDGCYGIKSAGKEEIQQIYDNGSDAFFNFDAIVEE